MRWSFRSKLTSIVFALIVTAVTGSAVFMLGLFSRDKLQSTLAEQVKHTAQAAHYLENLLTLLDVVDPEKVRESEQIAFLFDDACARHAPDAPSAFRGTSSRLFERVFADVGWDPSWWTGIELFQACEDLLAGDKRVIFLKPQRELPFRQLTLLARGQSGKARFAMVPMEGFGAAGGKIFFIADRDGKALWSSEGEAGLAEGLEGSGVTPADLAVAAREGMAGGPPKLVRAGAEGFLAYARSGDWVMLSLAHEPTAMRPVTYAIRQFILLAAGVLLLVLLAGKTAAAMISRPLLEVRAFAERVAGGELEARVVIGKREDPAIVTVKNALNSMTERVVKLLKDTEENAHLEQDLQVASKVQQMLLPQGDIEAAGNHSIVSFSQSATQCGGDWWGYAEVARPGKKPVIVLVIGDVVGHGTGPALVTGAARGAMSMLSSWGRANPKLLEDPANVASHFNRVIWDAARGALSMTLFAVVIDPEAGTLKVVNAGHNLPYMLVPEEGRPKLTVLGRSGVPLGYEPKKKYDEVDTYPWVAGCKLFLFTDGLTEVIKDEQMLYDRKALKRSLRSNGGGSARELLDGVMRERKEAILDQIPQDDTTVVVCECRP